MLIAKLHRDTLGLGLAYNFYVKPPTGAEYRLLATPQRLTSVNLNVLPVGVNSVRAVAIDARYAGIRAGADARSSGAAAGVGGCACEHFYLG